MAKFISSVANSLTRLSDLTRGKSGLVFVALDVDLVATLADHMQFQPQLFDEAPDLRKAVEKLRKDLKRFSTR